MREVRVDHLPSAFVCERVLTRCAVDPSPCAYSIRDLCENKRFANRRGGNLVVEPDRDHCKEGQRPPILFREEGAMNGVYSYREEGSTRGDRGRKKKKVRCKLLLVEYNTCFQSLRSRKHEACCVCDSFLDAEEASIFKCTHIWSSYCCKRLPKAQRWTSGPSPL